MLNSCEQNLNGGDAKTWREAANQLDEELLLSALIPHSVPILKVEQQQKCGGVEERRASVIIYWLYLEEEKCDFDSRPCRHRRQVGYFAK
jgi:hypothetical protein